MIASSAATRPAANSAGVEPSRAGIQPRSGIAHAISAGANTHQRPGAGIRQPNTQGRQRDAPRVATVPTASASSATVPSSNADRTARLALDRSGAGSAAASGQNARNARPTAIAPAVCAQRFAKPGLR